MDASQKNEILHLFLSGELTGSLLFDSISRDQLENLFPAKHRSAPAVQALFREFVKHRKRLHKEVTQNVDERYHKDGRSEGGTSSATALKRQEQADLEQAAKLDREIHAMEAELRNFAKDVQALQMGSSVSNKDITQLENNMEYFEDAFNI